MQLFFANIAKIVINFLNSQNLLELPRDVLSLSLAVFAARLRGTHPLQTPTESRVIGERSIDVRTPSAQR